MFSRYCAEPFSIEPVEIVSEHNGQSRLTPNVALRTMEVSKAYVNDALGLKLSTEEMSAELRKMSLRATQSTKDEDILDVQIPITRPDVLHPCDIMEDVGVGYGFNKVPKDGQLSNSSFIATPLPVNKISDIFREASAQSGWVEVLKTKR